MLYLNIDNNKSYSYLYIKMAESCSSSILKSVLWALFINLVLYVYGYNKLLEYVKIKYRY